MFYRVLVSACGCALLAYLLCAAPSPAQQPDNGAPARQAAGTEAGATSSGTTIEAGVKDAAPSTNGMLKGGVKGTAVQLDEGLARIAEAEQQAEQSCMFIMEEATRKDTVVMRGPNVLPGGVVIPALGGQGGVMQFGEMPIRKDKLKRWVANTEQDLAALKTYVDGLIVPADNNSAQTLYSSLRTAMQTAMDHLEALQDLSSQKRLANTKIGREALHIHDAMAEIGKIGGQLMQAVTHQ